MDGAAKVRGVSNMPWSESRILDKPQRLPFVNNFGDESS